MRTGSRRKTLKRRTIKRRRVGGDYLASGADTIVWKRNPNAAYPWLGLPIGFKNDTPFIPPFFERPDFLEYDPVVRMIHKGSTELTIHTAIKEWSERPEHVFVKMHMNTFIDDGVYETDATVITYPRCYRLGDKVDDPKLKAALKYGDYYKQADDNANEDTEDEEKKAKEVIIENKKRYLGVTGWYGLLTRTQKTDIYKLRGKEYLVALFEIARTLVHINGEWIHYDLHAANMAIMKDGVAAIHDFSNAIFPEGFTKKLLEDQDLGFAFANQYEFAGELLRRADVRKSEGINSEKLVTWLTGERLQQVARVWDLLAVLKAIHSASGVLPRLDWVTYSAAKAANEIIANINANPPTATVDVVNEIVWTCINEISSAYQIEFKKISMEEEREVARQYLATVNKARDGKVAAPAAPAPAPAAPAAPPAAEPKRRGRPPGKMTEEAKAAMAAKKAAKAQDKR